MDEESIMYLQTLFRTTVVATNNPIRSHWTEDWDVATILDALDELFPLQAEHRHLTVYLVMEIMTKTCIYQLRIKVRLIKDKI